MATSTVFGVLLVVSLVDLSGSTDCYVCYSWKDPGVRCEEDYMENVNLTTCGAPPLSPSSSSSFWRGDRNSDQEYRDRVINAPQTTCIKEVIIWDNPPIRVQNDRYNRFSRPWIERKCGNSIQASYRQGRDLIDDCEEIEVTIEGVTGMKRSCSCSTDGCNSASTSSISVLSLSLSVLLAKFGM